MNIEFLTVAREYCLLVENCPKYSPADFRKVAARMLAYLYVRASVLPENGEELLEDEMMESVDEFEYQNIWQQLTDKLGDDDAYIRVVDIRRDEEACQASISEDMADIYHSLKNFAENFRSGSEESAKASLSELISDFRDFWGYRCLSAMAALHAIMYSGSDMAYDDAQARSAGSPGGGFLDRFLSTKR